MKKALGFAASLLLLVWFTSVLAARPTQFGNKYAYLQCLQGNVTTSARIAQEVTDCLAAPVNALYLNVYPNPRDMGLSFRWSFSFRSYFVVVDVTKNYVDLLSFHTLSLNLCVLNIYFRGYCNASAYGFSESDERNLIGTFLFNEFIVNSQNSIQLGIINPTDSSSSDENSSSSSGRQGKIMTVEQSAYLCQLSSPSSHAISLFSPSYCCKNEINAPGFFGNNTLYPLQCPLQNEKSKRPLFYLLCGLIISGVVAILLVVSNIEYIVPVIYKWYDPISNADTEVPLFWGKPGKARLGTGNAIFILIFVAKFLILSGPIIWGGISQTSYKYDVLILSLVVMGITICWIIYVTVDEEMQEYIFQNIPQPLYAFTLLKKKFQSVSKRSKFSRVVQILLFVVPSFFVVLYVYMQVAWATVIIFFVVCGIAANTNELISTVSLVIALFIMIKTEYGIIRRPVMRVKVLLMNKEEFKGLTWGHVYTLLDKLHWLPMDIVKRRFPLYVTLYSVLSLIYFALKMFSDSQALMSNVIFQSVMMLVVGYIPSLLDREDYDEYTMLEMYKELGLKEIEEELKKIKFTKRGHKAQDPLTNEKGDEEDEDRNEKDTLLVKF